MCLQRTLISNSREQTQETDIFFFGLTANTGVRTSSLSRLHDHTQTHHTRQDSSGWVISPTQRPLPGNTQHPQEPCNHSTGGIRTHNPSKQATADPRLRPRGHLDLQCIKQIQLSADIKEFSYYSSKTCVSEILFQRATTVIVS